MSQWAGVRMTHTFEALDEIIYSHFGILTSSLMLPSAVAADLAPVLDCQRREATQMSVSRRTRRVALGPSQLEALHHGTGPHREEPSARQICAAQFATRAGSVSNVSSEAEDCCRTSGSSARS